MLHPSVLCITLLSTDEISWNTSKQINYSVRMFPMILYNYFRGVGSLFIGSLFIASLVARNWVAAKIFCFCLREGAVRVEAPQIANYPRVAFQFHPCSCHYFLPNLYCLLKKFPGLLSYFLQSSSVSTKLSYLAATSNDKKFHKISRLVPNFFVAASK